MPSRSFTKRAAWSIASLLTLAFPVCASAQIRETSSTDEINAPEPVPVASSAPASSAPIASASPSPGPTLVPLPGPADGIDPDAIRTACRRADDPDIIGWTVAGVYAAAGISLTLYSALYQTPTGMQTPVGIAYMGGIGPGLILGAIGVPIARGIFTGDAVLRSVCARMMRNAREHTDNPYDTYTADRVLRTLGEPQGFVLPLLIGLATAACIGLTIIPFATNNSDLAGPMGGISAAAIAAWPVLPPTPRYRAARHYVHGDYSRHGPVGVTPTVSFAPMPQGAGVSLVGTF